MDGSRPGLFPIEIAILLRVDHKSIVKMGDYFEDNKFFYLMMELHGSPRANRPMIHSRRHRQHRDGHLTPSTNNRWCPTREPYHRTVMS